MNLLDIILIIIGILLFILWFLCFVVSIKEEDVEFGCISFIILFAAFSIGVLSFIVLDRGSGTTIGTITSVDKNFFGTTAIYIKTSETEQEEYCIEDKKVVEKSKELIGKKVKVEYGTRVGLYSTGSCHEAPIKKIEEIKESEDK